MFDLTTLSSIAEPDVVTAVGRWDGYTRDVVERIVATLAHLPSCGQDAALCVLLMQLPRDWYQGGNYAALNLALRLRAIDSDELANRYVAKLARALYHYQQLTTPPAYPLPVTTFPFIQFDYKGGAL